jgi:hypothetical protein
MTITKTITKRFKIEMNPWFPSLFYSHIFIVYLFFKCLFRSEVTLLWISFVKLLVSTQKLYKSTEIQLLTVWRYFDCEYSTLKYFPSE